MIHALLRRLPVACITRNVDEYNNRPTASDTSREKEKRTFLLTRDAFDVTKMRAARQFLQWSEENRGPCTAKEKYLLRQGRIPYGRFSEYVRAHAELSKACCMQDAVKLGNRAYVRILRVYREAVRKFVARDSAVAERKPPSSSDVAVADGKPRDPDPFARFRNKRERTGSQYFSSGATFQRPSKRRRGLGAGRHRSCVVLRDLLATWYSIVRHSVDVKIMCRFPKKVILVQALILQQDYYTSCLKNNVQPEHVQVDGNWLNAFLIERRLSTRKPNRKFKVPRAVLAERLCIFWIVIAKLRKFILLFWGYDPSMRNVDQSPFHQHEAGSAACNTIALKGAPTVPLIENHAATRERWSLNSVTDSSKKRILKKLPGFEIMFKADGKLKEARLQAYVLSKGDLGFKVTVVTGPSGSYIENDILKFLANWCDLLG